jgi:hypothetical protein
MKRERRLFVLRSERSCLQVQADIACSCINNVMPGSASSASGMQPGAAATAAITKASIPRDFEQGSQQPNLFLKGWLMN